MIKQLFIILFCILMVVETYTIIQNLKPQRPKILAPCEGIDLRLFSTMNEIAENFNFLKIGYEGSTGFFCNQISTNYGYMELLVNNRTNIWISNLLLNTPKTLYNVCLHEILHALGLDHSLEQGMMNYSIGLSYFRNVLEDARKLWPSRDDFKGLKFLRKNM